MRRVAIVPARGGSKRLPRKNILPVEGRPMLSYPVAAALESGMFDEVVVSTEDSEVADIARAAGARVLDRPARLAEDRAKVARVCLHALEELDKDEAPVGEFCCVYATAILLAPEDFVRAHALLDAPPEADIVMGVAEYDLHPVKALKEEDGYLSRMWPEFAGVQSQFCPRLRASNGTLYWVKAAAFRQDPNFYPRRLKGYDMPRSSAVDIDTPEDLEWARLLAAYFLGGRS